MKRLANAMRTQRGSEPGVPHRVVVVGGGFGGLHAVRKLRRTPVDVTLVDRNNFHLFQPLVYQVATGALSPGEIATPLRHVFRRAQNVCVVLGEVIGFDLVGRVVVVSLADGEVSRAIPYDSLIVAGGSGYSYFGRDDWRQFAPDVKSLENALEVRRRILTAFEAAELEPDPDRRAGWLTFVVVGAGPTGVELAGQIAELARETLRRDFRTVDTSAARILLVDVADRVLPGFSPSLSALAESALERLGVTPRLERKVTAITQEAVTLADTAGEPEHVPARTVVWAAGVVASDLAAMLAAETGAELGHAGRVTVGPDLTVPGHPEVLAIGDMVQVQDAGGKIVPLPGVAPVAMQQGRYAAAVIRDRLRGRDSCPFRYRDKGTLATIGRARAVVDIKGVELSGLPAWLVWLFVHLFYLIGMQNRFIVFLRWTISFVTRSRSARLITRQATETVTSPLPHHAINEHDARRSRVPE